MTTNTTLTRLQQLLPELFQPLVVTGDLYLRFQLTPEIPALLPMARVQEALLVPATAISPLPNLPAFMIGMMNARDRVFWVVDLGQLLGLPQILTNPRDYQVVVMQLAATEPESFAERLQGRIDPAGSSNEPSLGLAVSRVRGVARFEPQHLQLSVADVPACLQPHLLGCFIEADKQILVFNPATIATAPTRFEQLPTD
ncbi:chemotaxis protein CheW [Chamaesiphon sp. OTE_75_metabat_556]|uniref:chemotaxis protein CheW n=1 Tax=Chamaesiphon sp. OTE_75_metabat_556 TaxID=2964692 RepID=UPI00286C8B84|nr:chemotaxis protein CheW [Chamaesiphon sp. OTE_75_metabat_556]